MATSAQGYDVKPKRDSMEYSEKGKDWPQILAIVAGSLGSFTDGVLFAWTSPFLIKLVEDKTNYNITENEASNLTIIQPLSMILTGAFFSKLCDIIGRKKLLLLLVIPHSLSLIVSAVARSIYLFYVARVFAGISNGIVWSSLPMYIGEVASPRVRDVWGNLLTSSIYVGQFAVNVVGGYCDVPTTSYIFLLVPVLFFVCFIFMPESPYFCIMKQDYETAKKSLQFLNRKENVDDDFNKIKKDVERQMSESGTWKDLLTINSNRKALLAGVFLRLSQQLGGVPVFNQYTQFIFQKAGGNVSPQVASMIFSAICICANFLVITFVMDKFSRKFLYTWSLVLTSIVLLALSAYFYIDSNIPSFDTSVLNWLPITAMLSYQIVTSFGVAIIPTLMLGELFSASIKAKALTVLMIVMASGVFVTNNIFNFMNSFVGSYSPFLFFTVCTLISAILSRYLVPETKGKTLEEIQMSLKAEKSS